MGASVEKFKPLTKIVLVLWRDANARGQWGSRSDYMQHNTAEIVSVGFLLKHTEDEITLVSNQDANWPDCNGAISIPSTWIISIKHLAKLDNSANLVVRSRSARKSRVIRRQKGPK